MKYSDGTYYLHFGEYTIELCHPSWNFRGLDWYIRGVSILRCFYEKNVDFGFGIVILGFGGAIIWTKKK